MKSSKGSSGKGLSAGAKALSPGRLSQKSGAANSFGGYTKINLGSGNFTMRKSGSAK